MKRMISFFKEEDGAVAVDWVVLTAGIVGLAVFAASQAESGILGLGDRVATEMSDTDV